MRYKKPYGYLILAALIALGAFFFFSRREVVVSGSGTVTEKTWRYHTSVIRAGDETVIMTYDTITQKTTMERYAEDHTLKSKVIFENENPNVQVYDGAGTLLEEIDTSMRNDAQDGAK